MNITKAIQNIPLLTLTPLLIAGVLCGRVFGIEFSFWCLVAIVPIILSAFIFKKRALYPALFLLGASLIYIKGETIEPYQTYSGRFIVHKILNKTDYLCRCIELDSVAYDNKIILVNGKREKLAIYVGDTISTNINPCRIEDSRIRGKIKYMEQEIEFFSKIDHNSYSIHKGIKKNTLVQDSTNSELVKKFISNRIDSLSCNDNSIALLQAMILGNKELLSAEQKEMFRSCGISHLLAISGWHVGIIFLFLNILLLPLGLVRHGNIVRSTVIVVIIWLYASLVGFTPSVCRAALMFTMFQYALFSSISRNMKYNVIFGSLLLFILYDYQYLFNLGFQLSYTAIISIHVFYSRIYNLFKRVNRRQLFVLNWIIKSLSLTLSAQILIIPIVLYYFGAFSLLSFLPNMALSLLLPLMIIITLLFTIFPNFIFDWIIGILAIASEHTIIFFDNWSLMIEDTYFTPFDIITYYIGVLLIIFILEKESDRNHLL